MRRWALAVPSEVLGIAKQLCRVPRESIGPSVMECREALNHLFNCKGGIKVLGNFLPLNRVFNRGQ
jgi:hypothetical protein